MSSIQNLWRKLNTQKIVIEDDKPQNNKKSSPAKQGKDNQNKIEN